jgi:hypothetical protein
VDEYRMYNGQEAYDTARTELLVARVAMQSQAQHAAADLAGDDRNPVKHAVRLALVTAIGYLDDSLANLARTFQVGELFAPRPELAAESTTLAQVQASSSELAGRRITANKAASRHRQAS